MSNVIFEENNNNSIRESFKTSGGLDFRLRKFVRGLSFVHSDRQASVILLISVVFIFVVSLTLSVMLVWPSFLSDLRKGFKKDAQFKEPPITTYYAN